jgi:DNA-binding response OmpR family regulator
MIEELGLLQHRSDHGSRVLIVEDDPSIQYALRELLHRDGFQVESSAEGAGVPGLLRDFEPHLVLLDLGLPDVNGFDLLRAVRHDHEVPIIVLSGREAESDRVLALELGADDYVVKPFLNRELVARIRVRLRRPKGSRDDQAGIGDDDLRIDSMSREVTLRGQPVLLTAKEFDLLHQMASAPRRVFSRQQLLAAVWDSSDEWQSDSTVTEHVHRLRQKVGADRIVTVRSVGYRFEPLVAAHVAE